MGKTTPLDLLRGSLDGLTDDSYLFDALGSWLELTLSATPDVTIGWICAQEDLKYAYGRGRYMSEIKHDERVLGSAIRREVSQKSNDVLVCNADRLHLPAQLLRPSVRVVALELRCLDVVYGYLATFCIEQVYTDADIELFETLRGEFDWLVSRRLTTLIDEASIGKDLLQVRFFPDSFGSN